MNLQQTKEIILIWVKSCSTAEQLEILLDVLQSHLVNRFTRKKMKPEELREVEMAKEDVIKEINDQRVIVVAAAAPPAPPTSVPTIDAYISNPPAGEQKRPQ